MQQKLNSKWELKMFYKNKNFPVLIIGYLVFIFYILASYYLNVTEYVGDSIIAIILLTIIFFFGKNLRLNRIPFSFLIMALALHTSGVFGWYGASPFFIQYDHITHFVGLLVVSILVYNFLSQYFTKNKVHNFIILVMILLVSLGIGSLVEEIEYIGYLKLGTGQGLLRFGGLGDTPFDDENLRAMDIQGGGWINTMIDLNYNFIGALSGTLLMYLINKFKSNKHS